MVRPSDKRIPLAERRRLAQQQYRQQQHEQHDTKLQQPKARSHDAQRKRESRLKIKIAAQDSEIEELRKEKRELRSKLQQQTAREQKTVSALLEEFDEAMGSSATTPDSGRHDMQGFNGAYSADYQIMAVQVMNNEISIRAAAKAIAMQSHHLGRPVKPPSERSLGRWERKGGIASEAQIAMELAKQRERDRKLDRKQKRQSAIKGSAAVGFDEATKRNRRHHFAYLQTKQRVFHLGTKETPTKSAPDQLQANKWMREDVARSGEKLFGIKPRDLLRDVKFTVTDGGATEQAIRRGLQKEKAAMLESEDEHSKPESEQSESEQDAEAEQSEPDQEAEDERSESVQSEDEQEESNADQERNGKDEKEDSEDEPERNGKDEKEEQRGKDEKEESDLIGLPCHKHLLSNVTTATEKDGVKQTGVGDLTAFDLGYKLADVLRFQATQGRQQSEAFDAFCKAKDLENWIGDMRPFAHSRHHNRWQVFAPILLSLEAVTNWLKKAAPQASRGAAVARGEAELAANNRCYVRDKTMGSRFWQGHTATGRQRWHRSATARACKGSRVLATRHTDYLRS